MNVPYCTEMFDRLISAGADFSGFCSSRTLLTMSHCSRFQEHKRAMAVPPLAKSLEIAKNHEIFEALFRRFPLMVHVSAQKHVQSQISAGLQVPWFLALDWLDRTGADDFLMWRPMGRLETPKAIRNRWLLLRIHSSIFQHISTIFIIFGWRNPDPQHAACSNVVISGCCSCESSNLCLPKVGSDQITWSLWSPCNISAFKVDSHGRNMAEFTLIG